MGVGVGAGVQVLDGAAGGQLVPGARAKRLRGTPVGLGEEVRARVLGEGVCGGAGDAGERGGAAMAGGDDGGGWATCRLRPRASSGASSLAGGTSAGENGPGRSDAMAGCRTVQARVRAQVVQAVRVVQVVGKRRDAEHWSQRAAVGGVSGSCQLSAVGAWWGRRTWAGGRGCRGGSVAEAWRAAWQLPSSRRAAAAVAVAFVGNGTAQRSGAERALPELRAAAGSPRPFGAPRHEGCRPAHPHSSALV